MLINLVAATLILSGVVVGQTFQRLGGCPELGCIFPPDQCVIPLLIKLLIFDHPVASYRVLPSPILPIFFSPLIPDRSG